MAREASPEGRERRAPALPVISGSELSHSTGKPMGKAAVGSSSDLAPAAIPPCSGRLQSVQKDMEMIQHLVRLKCHWWA